VCIHAVDVGPGSNALIKCESVVVPS
jgi:hypothetical protein